ncbi:YncE family protein [Pararhizobium sp. IMCC21322]|uniref:YncE family protein n=1 Tax=Pararhizobium sp. IMCC21322 TaxID=3067903 RepID=UPI002741E702|nr:YncE family protein [Pararhizobium sp. IMCC21322]
MKCRNLRKVLATASVGALISGMAVAQTVFIPEGSANSVLMVDASTGSAIRRIDGLEAVHGLSGAPGVPVLVAGSYAEIDRDDVAQTAQPESVSADEHAAHHAPTAKSMGPADAGVSLLSILDTQTGEILRRIEVPGAVHHTAVSPDGRFAVATHPSNDGISVIDLKSFKMTAWIPTGAMPNYAVFDVDRGTVYVSNAGNGTVSEVDLARGIVRRNMVVGAAPEHMVIDAVGRALYVADADAGRVLELALESGETRRSFDLGGEIHGIALTDDRTRLIVAGRGEDILASIDLARGVITTVPLAPEPYHLTTIPGTGRIFVSSRAKSKVWIINPVDLSVTGEFPVMGEGHQMVVMN